jgi:hypothetical protein
MGSWGIKMSDKIDNLIEQYLAWDELVDTEKEMADTLEETNTAFIRQLAKGQSNSLIKNLVSKRKNLVLAQKEEIRKALKAIQAGQKGQSPEWVRARSIYKKKEIIKKYLPQFKKIKNRILDLKATL